MSCEKRQRQEEKKQKQRNPEANTGSYFLEILTCDSHNTIGFGCKKIRKLGIVFKKNFFRDEI
jgi:uncharacterized membrane protein YcgQ (UPF0703/DUF1980 family)